MSRLYEALRRRELEESRALAPFSRPTAQQGAVPAPSNEPVFDVRSLVWTLFRRRWEILLIASLVVIPVAVATYRAERLYRASALVQVDPEPVQVLPYREVDANRSGPNYEMFMKGQEQLLRGATIINRVSARVTADPKFERVRSELPNLAGRLSIQRLQETQLFVLSYVAPNPEAAATVANLYAEEYIKLHFEARQRTRDRAKQLLERELGSLEKRIQSSEKELVTYAQGHSIPTAEQGVSLVQEKLSAVGGQLSAAEGDSYVAQSRVEMLRNASVSQFPERLMTPVISGITARLVQLENELTVLRESFGENWPTVKQKRTEISLAREQLDREKASSLEQAREQAALDHRAAESRRRLLASSLAGQKQLANQLETASIQYNIVRREVETNRKMYEGMLERLKQTSVTAGMEFEGFHVIEPASPSSRLYSPKVWWNLALASILGLALGVCVAFVRDYWDISISTISEVEELSLPVLGALPHVASPAHPHTLLARLRSRAAIASGPAGASMDLAGPAPSALPASGPGPFASNTEASEAVRNVCASILLSRSGRPPRVLMVTSSVTGEGKTTVAREVGRALADGGSSTLLIECDLRRPELGAALGVGSEGGLSLFLAGHVGPTPVIHPTSAANLFVVVAGPQSPNPPALLNSAKLQSFLASAAEAFRFVILDAPPVLPIADARVLAPLVEGVVLVVRAGVVSRQMVRRTRSLLEGAGANILGAVLNDADPQRADGAQYRYSRHYYDES